MGTVDLLVQEVTALVRELVARNAVSSWTVTTGGKDSVASGPGDVGDAAAVVVLDPVLPDSQRRMTVLLNRQLVGAISFRIDPTRMGRAL